MDILKVLAFNNDRGVRETVISSVVNYFPDPYVDHGIGGELLGRVLKGVAREVPELKPAVITSILNPRIVRDTMVSVSAEWGGVPGGTENQRRIDKRSIRMVPTEAYA